VNGFFSTPVVITLAVILCLAVIGAFMNDRS
jgi:hypothetical protein